MPRLTPPFPAASPCHTRSSSAFYAASRRSWMGRPRWREEALQEPFPGKAAVRRVNGERGKGSNRLGRRPIRQRRAGGGPTPSLSGRGRGRPRAIGQRWWPAARTPGGRWWTRRHPVGSSSRLLLAGPQAQRMMPEWRFAGLARLVDDGGRARAQHVDESAQKSQTPTPMSKEGATHVVEGTDGRKHWIGGENIKAVAHDVPIPGYKTKTTNNLRLWSTTVPSQIFDLGAFNAGDHTKANEAHLNAEKICHVLYPGDESSEGKVLRLKQQYTLCSASLQDIISRFETRAGDSLNWEDFPSKVAVQMNDTHPTLCIPELMRILMDVKGLSWNEAWSITERTVAYTNHAVLPEALEKCSFDIMQKLLPRHVEIIETIDEELPNVQRRFYN